MRNDLNSQLMEQKMKVDFNSYDCFLLGTL